MFLCVNLFGHFKDQSGNAAKKMRFYPEIPSWELCEEIYPCSVSGIQGDYWVNLHGETVQPPTHVISAKEVSRGRGFRLDSLAFRNPDFFMAGQLHSCVEEWKKLDTPGFVFDWIQNREDIFPMFKHF